MQINNVDYRCEKLKKMEERLLAHEENRLYIWGCASTARMIASFVEKNSQIGVEAYIVDDAFYTDAEFCGKKVYKASEWSALARSGDCVIMGFTDSKRAENVIANLPGGVEGVYFYFPYSSIAYGSCLSYEDYISGQMRFQRVYELLEDEISRQTMEAFLNGCISGDVGKLDQLQTDGQYFNELTKDCEVKYFIDCGAYVGDTIEAAAAFYKERLKGVISFEPDEKNISMLKERVRKCAFPKEKLYLVEKGSWSEQTTLRFSSDQSSSSISETGDVEIEVDSIDHVMESINQPVGFIKMDVEGSEKETLYGAEQTIRRYHPLLAVCVYHKPQDIYELTETILALSKERPYRFYMRYHGPDLRELVLYAV